jgi:excisionase family DNA binding protein
MYVTSPEQRHQMWHDALAHRGKERETRLHYIVLDMHAELSALDIYTEYREPLEDAVKVLDSVERFLDHSMLMTYQALGAAPSDAPAEAKADAPARMLALLVGRLSEVACDEAVAPSTRVRAADLTEFWRQTLRETEKGDYLSVAQLAGRHGVTPQAVYKWIHSGKIQAEERPGGSYRIPTGQFRTSAALLTRRAETRRKVVQLQGDEPVTEEEIVAALRANRHGDEPH